MTDAMIIALIPASVAFGGASVALYGHWTKARTEGGQLKLQTSTTRVTVEKTEAEAGKIEQEVEINWQNRADGLQAKVFALREEFDQAKADLERRLAAVEQELETKSGLLSDCQSERLGLSRLVTHTASDRDRWRLSTLACEFIFDALDEWKKTKRMPDEMLLIQAKARIEEAYQGEKLPEPATGG